jgi:D-alanine-D-alanine ligase
LSFEEKKLRVGIIMGGMSSEREVSLESGRNIFNKIDRMRYEPVPLFLDCRGRFWRIDMRLLMRNSTADIEEDLADQACRIPYEELPGVMDLAFLALHGKYGEDGCIQGLLELKGLAYTGSGVLGSALGMDKEVSRRLLTQASIDVPASITLRAPEGGPEKDRSGYPHPPDPPGGFPCIVKPAREGCSTAVAKVFSPEKLAAAIAEAFRWDDKVLLEEYVEGQEVTCGVLERAGKPLALTPSETIPTGDVLSLEDKFLYGQGENKTPARLPRETILAIQETAVRTFRALGLRGYCRVDMIVRPEGRICVLEPNSLPGLTPSTVLFHQAAVEKITPTDLLGIIIEAAKAAHAAKKGPL